MNQQELMQKAKEQQNQLAQQGKLMMPGGQKPIQTGIQMGHGQCTPFVVNARDCVDESHLHLNISENIKLINRFVDQVSVAHGTKAIIASAGPSLKNHLDYIKKEQENGAKVFCVKHSLPTLVKAGINPDGCVALDPRDIKGTSTHNVVRQSLYENFPKDMVFYIASMTDPSVTRFLKSKGAKIVGWHGQVADIQNHFKYFAKFAITGGSCSAVRAINLLHFMGFRDFTLIGFDCSFDETPKDLEAKLHDGRPKYMPITCNGKQFISTGELVALCQDLERIGADSFSDFKIDMLEGGLGYESFMNGKRQSIERKGFDDFVEEIVQENLKPFS